MLVHANLPNMFWGDAILTIAYILNRVPSKSVTSTPYKLWTGRKPDLGHLHPWGTIGFVHIPSQLTGKLNIKAKTCTFMCYSETSKGYLLLSAPDNGGMTEWNH